MLSSPISRQEIKNRAKQVLMGLYQAKKKQLGTSPSVINFYPVEPEMVVRDLNWKIDEVAQLGFTSYCKSVKATCLHEKRIIRIATDEIANLGHKHFTIAHEIGHIFLHRPPLVFTDLNRTDPPSSPLIGPEYAFRTREREADMFATELLMPEKAVRWQFREMFGRESLSPRLVETQFRDLKQFALDLAAREMSKDASKGKSLMGVFSVSRSAMAGRLIELDLAHT